MNPVLLCCGIYLFLLQNSFNVLAKPIPAPESYYASRIVAVSSQHSKHGHWSAAAALGAPNSVSWCAYTVGRLEFMEVEFPKYIAISSINIQFRKGPGTLTHVSIFDKTTNSYDYVFARPLPVAQHDPTLFALSIHPPRFSNRVKIHMNLKNGVYAYIDAIRIFGIPEKPSSGNEFGEQLSHKAVLSTSLDAFHGVRRTFTESDPNITDDTPGPQPTYKSIIVEQGVWILYATVNFSTTSSRPQRADKGTNELHFQPKSLRPIPAIPNSVTLFEHNDYGGMMVTINNDKPDLKEFAVMDDGGVSSIIVEPTARWEFYTGVNYTGQMFTLSSGYYRSPSKFFNQNERIQSVKRADESG